MNKKQVFVTIVCGLIFFPFLWFIGDTLPRTEKVTGKKGILIPGWNKKNGWLKTPYYQGFIEFPIDLNKKGGQLP